MEKHVGLVFDIIFDLILTDNMLCEYLIKVCP